MKFSLIAITFAIMIIDITALRMENVPTEYEEVEYEPVEVEDVEDNEDNDDELVDVDADVERCWMRGGLRHCN